MSTFKGFVFTRGREVAFRFTNYSILHIKQKGTTYYYQVDSCGLCALRTNVVVCTIMKIS